MARWPESERHAQGQTAGEADRPLAESDRLLSLRSYGFDPLALGTDKEALKW